MNSKMKKFSYSFICGKGYSPPLRGRIAFYLPSGDCRHVGSPFFMSSKALHSSEVSSLKPMKRRSGCLRKSIPKHPLSGRILRLLAPAVILHPFHTSAASETTSFFSFIVSLLFYQIREITNALIFPHHSFLLCAGKFIRCLDITIRILFFFFNLNFTDCICKYQRTQFFCFFRIIACRNKILSILQSKFQILPFRLPRLLSFCPKKAHPFFEGYRQRIQRRKKAFPFDP